MSWVNRKLLPFWTASSLLFSLLAILVALCLYLSLFSPHSLVPVLFKSFFFLDFSFWNNYRLMGKSKVSREKSWIHLIYFLPVILYYITMLCCAYLLSRIWLFANPWTVAWQAPLSMGILQARILECLPCPSSWTLPNPVIKLRSHALQAYSSPSERSGKPKNTGVGSLCLLEGIFLTQELSQSLLHCRRILYQLSYQGSPLYNYNTN